MELSLLDATLREGEQRSGRSYSVDQKVAAARKLDDLGLDMIQVGFPVAEDGTKEVCERLDTDAKIAGIARAIESDIDAAADAGVDVIQFSIPSSDLQREHLIGVSREELKEMAVSTLNYARDTGQEVHFGTMDGFRTDPEYLNELMEAIDTPYFGISDTVGARKPGEVVDFLEQLDGDLSRISVHFHRDLGVGTANVLAAAECGVGKADVTVGGIGERVGNVSFEEVVVSGSLGSSPIDFSIEVDNLVSECKEILDILGEDIPPNKPILGELAYEHESGMHTSAMLDDPDTFQAFEPARFGGERRLLFGPSSGKGSSQRLLEQAGIEDPSSAQVSNLLDRLHGFDEHVSLERALELAREEANSNR
ncbi:LeuA family protein [Salinirubellus sp. GCM10025818]|uniref:LeuA family protein n=1 Tax=Salinirubellus TaxID=2162630 RepID=UPI0030CFF52F